MGFKKSIQYFFSKRSRITNTKRESLIPFEDLKIKSGLKKFPIFEKPEVSILVYNPKSIEALNQCLYSICNNIPQCSFEVILLTDNPEFKKIDKEYDNITIANIENRLPLSEILNVGIEVAKGEYIYLLDGSSVVEKSSIDDSFELLKSNHQNAIIGSKILNSKGELIEAGGFILENNQFLKRNNLPNYFPEVNYVQKVDFCTINGLLLQRKNIDSTLVKFDNNFNSPNTLSYNFCLDHSLNKGREIVFNPFSILTDLSQENIESSEEFAKVTASCKEYLKQIRANNISERSSEIHKHKQVLFYHYKLPEFENSSGDLRYTEIMKEFMRIGYQGAILCTKNDINNPYNRVYQQLGLCVLYEHVNGNEMISFLKRNYFKNPISWFYSIITFNKFYKKVKSILTTTKVVFDMVDIHHLRTKRALEIEPTNKKYKKEYPKFLKLEKWASKISDVVIPISDMESQYMEQYADPNKLVMISNIHYPKVKLNEIPTFEERKGIIFVGSRHAPNIDAVHYLLDDIMPLVWKSLPEIEVNVIGEIDTLISEERKNIPNVNFHGFVPDMTAFLLNSKIMVAPLRYGAGVKGKVGQAFEYYLPVITSNIGAEGMSLEDDENALLAENKEAFANQIIRLYNNKELWEKLQNNSERSLLPFSIQKLQEKIQVIIQK